MPDHGTLPHTLMLVKPTLDLIGKVADGWIDILAGQAVPLQTYRLTTDTSVSTAAAAGAGVLINIAARAAHIKLNFFIMQYSPFQREIILHQHLFTFTPFYC